MNAKTDRALLNRWHRRKNYSAIQWLVPSQPRNHREIDRVAPRDRCQGFACSTPLDDLSPLIGRELGLAAKFDAIRHRPPAALAGALPDQLALKLRDGGQERDSRLSTISGAAEPKSLSRPASSSLDRPQYPLSEPFETGAS